MAINTKKHRDISYTLKLKCADKTPKGLLVNQTTAIFKLCNSQKKFGCEHFSIFTQCRIVTAIRFLKQSGPN
jgi:hypothetical protein